MDYQEIDRRAVLHVTQTLDVPVLACYRTGSAADGTAQTHSDVDYIVLADLDEHSPYGYASRVCDTLANKLVDFVRLTKRDLESPSTIPEEQGRDDKIAYLMRELSRQRILLHGVDAFLALLNEEELREVAEQLGIDSGSMARNKNAVLWD